MRLWTVTSRPQRLHVNSMWGGNTCGLRQKCLLFYSNLYLRRFCSASFQNSISRSALWSGQLTWSCSGFLSRGITTMSKASWCPTRDHGSFFSSKTFYFKGSTSVFRCGTVVGSYNCWFARISILLCANKVRHRCNPFLALGFLGWLNNLGYPLRAEKYSKEIAL